MKLILICLLLTFCFSSIAFAQDTANDASIKALELAAKNGNALRTQITVNGNIRVQAVLIPRVDAKRIFGSEIANNYAVIEVNVGNKSPDAALIIHGIFIDYAKWPLSGSTPDGINAPPTRDSFEESTFPHQVASEEYRVVRGQLLDAQTDTLRNRFLRWLTLAGNLAGAFTFSINEQGIVKGIAAATGVGIPGVATAWPDKTIEQLNRVSDFGFRTNKVIPKQSAEVIVCFFPIDRFLTRGFRKLFLKSPAVFFAPLQMLVDKTVKKDFDDAVGDLLAGQDLTPDDLRGALPCFMTIAHPRPNDPAIPICLSSFGLEKDPKSTAGAMRVKVDANGNPVASEVTKFKKFMILEFIGSVSLNRVTITVDGVMSVNISTIAARLDSVQMNNLTACGQDAECYWRNVSAGGGVRKGTIRGAYLGTGKVVLAEQEALGITDLKVEDGSTEDELQFSFKLGKPIANQTKLHFTVLKDDTSDATKPKKLESNTWEYLVAYSPLAAAITSRSLAGSTLTVVGRGFLGTPLVVTLQSDAGTEIAVTPTVASLTDTQFDIALPTANPKFKAGCWYVQVTAGGLTSNQSQAFLSATPAPTLDSAIRTSNSILLKGKDLLNFSHCDGPKISFRLNQTGAASVPLTVSDWNNGEPVLLLPEAAKTGSWKVEVLVGGSPIAPTAVTVDLKSQTP